MYELWIGEYHISRTWLYGLFAASWLIVNKFRFVLAAAQRELPAERIRCAHDDVLGRVQVLIERGPVPALSSGGKNPKPIIPNGPVVTPSARFRPGTPYF